MAYQPPTINENGITIPTYQDLMGQLMQDYYDTFGSGSYIEIDAADYEWMSILARQMYETFLLLQQSYINRSPSTVLGGEPQDSLYTINGIRRKSATKSTCVVVLSGIPGTVITNGVVRDVAGNLWDLTSPVTIGSNGTVNVTATAQQVGRIIAQIGDIRFINTPTFGWNSVINNVTGITGSAIETNQEFRERRMWSVANPSQSIIEGIIGGVAASDDGISRFKIYENDTNITDSNGIPPHTICVVVEGGDANNIANAIYLRKTPGCGTLGDQVITIYDRYMNPTPISFYYASYIPLYITVNIKELSNFTADDEAQIKTNIKEFIDTKEIGETVFNVDIIRAAMDANINSRQPSFTVVSAEMGIDPDAQTEDDVNIGFTSIATTEIINIEVVST